MLLPSAPKRNHNALGREEPHFYRSVPAGNRKRDRFLSQAQLTDFISITDATKEHISKEFELHIHNREALRTFFSREMPL